MGHSHDHHHHAKSSTRALLIAFILNFSFSVFEFWGGFNSNSISVISDAFHDFGDAIALALAWYFEKLSQTPRDTQYNYGYRRFSLMGSVLTSVILIAGSIFIAIESIGRWQNPEPIKSDWMMALAVVGILGNGIAAKILSNNDSHNFKVAFLHMLEDMLGWVAVLIAGITVHYTGFVGIDSLLSFLISLVILYKALQRLYSISAIFLQRIPDNTIHNDVIEEIKKLPNVINAHHLQVWSLDGEEHVASLHVLVDDQIKNHEIILIKQNIRKILDRRHIHQSTIEFEYNTEVCNSSDKMKS